MNLAARGMLAVALLVPVWRAGQAQDTRPVKLERGAADPAVSPDGKSIAAAIVGRIWLIPVGGGPARAVTNGEGWAMRPAWSPDGRFLAYASARPAGTELVIRNLSTGADRTVHSVARPNERFVTYNAMVTGIAFHPTKPELWFSSAGVFSLPIAGGDPVKQMSIRGGAWTISPDGKTIAIDQHAEDATNDIYLRDLDSLSVKRVTSLGDSLVAFEPVWTRGGDSLVYLVRDNGVEAVMIGALSGGTPRRVFESMHDAKQLAMHPDGKSLVMTTGRRLARLDLTTGRLTPIPFEATVNAPVPGPSDLVINNASLWDGTGKPVESGASVEVANGLITRVSTSGPIAAKPGVPTIDARGRFLMPGLMDSHFHYWYVRIFAGADLLAMGITSIRDPAGDLIANLSLRDAMRAGLLAGPDMYIATTTVNGIQIGGSGDMLLTKPEKAASLVRAYKALGADLIKLYTTLAPDVLRAVMDEARKQQILVTGDLSRTTWSEAIDAGIDGLNHLCNYVWGFAPPAMRLYDGSDPWEYSVWAARFVIPFQKRPIVPPPAEIDAVLERMAARNVALDPTITVCNATAPGLTRQELLDRMISEVEWGNRRRAAMADVLLRANRAGVRLLAGTDGPSLFDELESYERIGLPRDVILQMASINGAKWMGRDAEFGTIEPGKRADLILVDGDPLKEIKALRNVSFVAKEGRIIRGN